MEHSENIALAKKTKIVATIGPATASESMLERLIREGVNVVRLNFSHGTHDDHKTVIERVRAISDRLNVPVGILQDLSGPKIRTGDLKEPSVELVPGDTLVLTTDECIGDAHRMHVTYSRLPNDVRPGARILLDDGRRELRVERVEGNDIICTVVVGGAVKPRRGVNLPGTSLNISCLTVKDRADLEFGIAEEVDFVALSFVRTPEDIQELKSILAAKGSAAAVISKVETQEAINNIDAIIAESDAIMVARGDLAIEVPREDVPILQKTIVEKCSFAGKGTIIATQMLESMIHAPVPTRAEVSDVANSILDGADATMLSEETALGSYPVEAVKTMARVAKRVEGNLRYKTIDIDRDMHTMARRDVINEITHAAFEIANSLEAKAIVALTETGSTARMIARFNPTQPIIVMTPHPHVYRRMALYYGCVPVIIEPFQYIGEMYHQVTATLKAMHLAEAGDKAVIIAGVPFGQSGGTNLVVAHTLD